eukprot:GHVP01019474.1.p1 GENE.GHVP01019474.1~~GHVP01019474.1.p1  ORF type:complete len:255 (-),score=54.64 GHVP01019474.1:118-882(-)
MAASLCLTALFKNSARKRPQVPLKSIASVGENNSSKSPTPKPSGLLSHNIRPRSSFRRYSKKDRKQLKKDKKDPFSKDFAKPVKDDPIESRNAKQNRRKTWDGKIESFVKSAVSSVPEPSEHSQFSKLSASGNIRIGKEIGFQEFGVEIDFLESYFKFYTRNDKQRKKNEEKFRENFKEKFGFGNYYNLSAYFVLERIHYQIFIFEVMPGKTSKKFLGTLTGLVAKKLRKDCTKAVIQDFFDEKWPIFPILILN